MSIKIKLLGKNLEKIREILDRYGLKDCGTAVPDVVVTYGGDGALLGAEREFPGVLKLPLRDAETAPTCAEHEAEKMIREFIAGSLVTVQLPKLCAAGNGRELWGINDLVLHTREYTTALRYRVFIDGELYAQEVVGDGLCFAGVHGSSAYYRSITRGIFRTGVGVAFSNSTEVVDHLVLPEKSVVAVEILRGTGVVMADNDPEKFEVHEGEKVIFRQTDEKAQICNLAGFMCPECRYLRHHLLPLNGKRK